MNKQELIKIYEDTSCTLISIKGVLEDLRQLDEPQKVTVPQFVAEWYEENKNNLDKNIYDCIVGWGIHSKEIRDWMRETKPFQTLVNMHQFGYEVEQEKRYLVKIKGIEEDINCLNYDCSESGWYFADDENGPVVGTHHTRKELEEADFGWVFDCPGIEIEEAEDDSKI